MKILLIYYTGTYNTRYLANRIASRFIASGDSVDLYECFKGVDTIDLTSYDRIGLGYPIYAFNSPRLFDRLLRKMHFKDGQKFFIFKQSGESFGVNDASSRTIKRIIKRKRGKLLVEHHFLLPYNIHFRYDDRLVKQELEYDDKLLDILIFEIKSEIRDIIHSNIFYDLNSFLFSIQRIAGFVNGPLYKVDKSKCINCNICINNCPVGNIYRKGDTIRFKRKCEMCMRCTLFCPKDAIHMGMLDKWRVNGRYDLEKIYNDKNIKGDYVKEKEKGFYSCFKRSFDRIDKLHDKLFLCYLKD
jgi:ferredoxin/flavodoxin